MAVFRANEPNKPGLYWLEKEDRDEPIPIRVIYHHDYLAVASTEVGVEWIDGAWTGPLPTPEEMEAEAERDVAEEIHRLRHDMYVEKKRE
jgi:hypothetical protein